MLIELIKGFFEDIYYMSSEFSEGFLDAIKDVFLEITVIGLFFSLVCFICYIILKLLEKKERESLKRKAIKKRTRKNQALLKNI